MINVCYFWYIFYKLFIICSLIMYYIKKRKLKKNWCVVLLFCIVNGIFFKLGIVWKFYKNIFFERKVKLKSEYVLDDVIIYCNEFK